MTTFSRTRTQLDGVELEMWEGGAGPTLLYLYSGGAADLFRCDTAPFLTRLAETHRVLVPEHPGFGTRDRPGWLDSVHDLAYFYLDLLRNRSLQQVALVGHGLGGWIALELAVRNTDRLCRLALAGAAGIRVPGIPRGDLFLSLPEQTARALLQDPAAAERYLRALLRDKTAEEQREALRNRETLALLCWEPRLFDPGLERWLHRIDIPTQIVWGEHDRLLPLPHGEALAAAIPGARLTVIPDAGHLMQLDRPAAFCAAVSAALAEAAG